GCRDRQARRRRRADDRHCHHCLGPCHDPDLLQEGACRDCEARRRRRRQVHYHLDRDFVHYSHTYLL
ncbi:hypothetical protein HK101_008743, partial [Irineochytrium annulatum]